MKQANAESQYRAVLKNILRQGTWKPNRTGIDSIALPYPAVIIAHMGEGFPLITGRRAPFKSASAELCGFLRGDTSAADFRALGCKYWDQNANENAAWLANPFRKGEDDLGDVYGAQWRRWPAYAQVKHNDPQYSEKKAFYVKEDWTLLSEDAYMDGQAWVSSKESLMDVWFKEIDQLGDCVRTIIKDPNNRGILFHAWNPAKLDEIALRACHVMYQFMPNSVTKELSMSLTIRSNDMPLGWPSNIAEAALMLHLVARLTGYKPAYLTVMSNDGHIYRNQLEMVEEYLARPTYDLPKLVISDRVPTYLDMYDNVLDGVMSTEGDPHTPLPRARADALIARAAVSWLDKVEPTDFSILNYVSGEPISAPMAV